MTERTRTTNLSDPSVHYSDSIFSLFVCVKLNQTVFLCVLKHLCTWLCAQHSLRPRATRAIWNHYSELLQYRDISRTYPPLCRMHMRSEDMCPAYLVALIGIPCKQRRLKELFSSMQNVGTHNEECMHFKRQVACYAAICRDFMLSITNDNTLHSFVLLLWTMALINHRIHFQAHLY